MSLWSRKETPSPVVEPSQTIEAEVAAKDMQELLEYTYMSGWNYAWSIIKATQGDSVRKPSGRAQFRKWCVKMLQDERFKRFSLYFIDFSKDDPS